MISIREYARRKGISHTAVQVAIKSGRLVKSIAKDDRGSWKIADESLADQEWAANTDQSAPRNRISGDPKRRKGVADVPYEPRDPGGAAPSGPDTGGEAPAGGPSYARSRAVREAFQAQLARLEYQEKTGKLLQADAVRVAIFNATRKCRDMLMGMPDRVAPLLVGQTSLFEAQRILNDEVRRVLIEISDLKVLEKVE